MPRTLGTMSNFVQWAQLGVAHAQLSELHSLNSQFQQQHNAQRHQAILGDMLFRTEQRAKQVSVIAASDPLVAAIFADEWLASISRVTPDAFTQVDHKRAWAAAFSRLQAVRATLDHPQARDDAHQARSAAADVRGIYAALGNAPNPDAQAGALQHEHDGLAKQSARALTVGLALGAASIAIPVLMAIVGAIADAIVGKHQNVGVDTDAINAFGFLIFLGLAAVAIYQLAQWSDSGTKAKRALAKLETFRQALGRLQAFQADPGRGGFLQRFYATHPAYGQALPNVDHMGLDVGVAGPVSTHVVERQTVVTRCKYCGGLTPVDAKACQHCGAGNFS